MKQQQFLGYLYLLMYEVGTTSRLKSVDWLRLKVAKTSGLLNEEEKQICDRILHSVEYKRISLIEQSSPFNQPSSYQSYKMLCHNQPAEYFCQLLHQLVETNTLSEMDLQMLQEAKESNTLNFEEQQLIKRIFYSIKRGRIKLEQTPEVSLPTVG